MCLIPDHTEQELNSFLRPEREMNSHPNTELISYRLISDPVSTLSGLWWEDHTPQFDPFDSDPWSTIRAIRQNEGHTLERQGM